jgi:competence protein ComGC
MTNKNLHTGAFTLVEILIVLTLAGLIALPFTNMFIFGVKGSNDNTEQVLAYNLAREKIEEIKSLPYDHIKSDYENFREVFQDRVKYDEAYYNEEGFVEHFTDVFTEAMMASNEHQTSFTKLKLLYPKAFLKPLILYPNDYSRLRRVAQVELIMDSAQPPKMKKITVMVFDDRNRAIATLVTMIGQS